MEELHFALISLLGGEFLFGVALLAWSAAKSQFLTSECRREVMSESREHRAGGEAWIYLAEAGSSQGRTWTSGMLCLVDKRGFKRGFSVPCSARDIDDSLMHASSITLDRVRANQCPRLEENHLLDLLMVRCAQIHNWDSCVRFFSEKLSRSLVYSGKLASLRDWEKSPSFDSRERTALGLCELIHRDAPTQRLEELLRVARNYYAEQELLDIIFCILAVGDLTGVGTDHLCPSGREISEETQETSD